MIEIEHPSGETLRIPESWTDLAEPSAATMGGEAKASARELLDLARLVRALVEGQENS